MSRTDAPLCKDCKNFRPISLECSVNPTTSLVTGNTIYTDAHEYRQASVLIACGRLGKWFEPIREEADLDDLSTIPFGKQP